jgi:hypothetical protein
MENAKEVKLKNGRAAMKGNCPKCKTGMFKIGGATPAKPAKKK